jgi:GntR family transcriptional regulator
MLFFEAFEKLHGWSGPMLLVSDNYSPKYAQIANVIRQRIARGQWPKGHQLPANDELAEEFGVSRVTIRQAVELLVRDGLVEPQQGRGTFVTGTISEDRWLRVETNLADLAEVYRDTSPEILNISEGTICPPLRLEDGVASERYVYMRRVHSRNQQPYCVVSIYIDETVFRKHAVRFRKEVVIPILATMRAPKIVHAHQTLTIGSADLEVARLLRVPLNSPVAEVRRVFNSADMRVIYLGEVTYRGDFVRIEMDLRP